jgi:hypothetical protein
MSSSVVTALNGLKGQVRSISENLKTLYGAHKNYNLLSENLRPVYLITTSHSLSEGTTDDVILADTMPSWVPQDFVGTGSFTTGRASMIRHVIQRKWDELKSTLSHDPVFDNPVVGVLTDESPKNIYRGLADIIFRNVPYSTVTGERKWLAENFILLGFPIRLTMGFVDLDGRFVGDPYKRTTGSTAQLHPDFTGILGGFTTETLPTGDFFQGTFVGYEYLLNIFKVDNFPVHSNEKLSRALARMLQWFATGQNARRIKDPDTGKYTTASLLHPRIPTPVLIDMGLFDQTGLKVKNLSEIEKSIMFKYFDPDKREVRLNQTGMTNRFPNTVHAVGGGDTFFHLLKYLQEQTNTDIYFNEWGQLTVEGKQRVIDRARSTVKFLRGGRRKQQVKQSRPTVHDAVIGVNAIHQQQTIDLDQITNKVAVIIKHPNMSAGMPDLKIITPNIDKPIAKRSTRHFTLKFTSDEDEVMKFYGRDVPVGEKIVYTLGTSSSSTEVNDPILEALEGRYRYWGMKGTCYMMGNPKIRCGDVLRVMDIRTFGLHKSPVDAVSELSRSISEALDDIASRYPSLSDMEKQDADARRFKILSGDGLYYIWKVLHYIGPEGFTSKVFFIRSPEAPKTSDLYGQHLRKRRKGMELGEDLMG